MSEDSGGKESEELEGERRSIGKSEEGHQRILYLEGEKEVGPSWDNLESVFGKLGNWDGSIQCWPSFPQIKDLHSKAHHHHLSFGHILFSPSLQLQ